MTAVGIEKSTVGESGETVEARLRRFLVRELPDVAYPEVADVEPVRAGMSKENWLFTARWREGGVLVEHPMIARREPSGALLDTAVGTEFRVLAALAATPVPAPCARWLDPDGSVLGRPALVMDRLPGICDYFLLTDAARPLAARLDLARQLVDRLAEIHDLDWRSIGLGDVLAVPSPKPSLAALDHWQATFDDHFVEPYPELALVTAWLRAHAPTARAITLVHGDVKPGNVLVAEGHITGVLDWETAHLGDPLEDLGWMVQPRRQREQQIAGAWETNEIVDRYIERSGRDVPEADLLWWTVLACVKAAVIQLTALKRFLDGRNDQLVSAPLPLLRASFDLIGL